MAKSDQAHLVAILSYITFIGWIIALILHMNKKTALGGFHVRQGLMVILVSIVLGWIPLIGWILALVVWIIGLIGAITKSTKPIPIIGPWAQDWFKPI